MYRCEQGYTLVELLIVIFILGVAASVAIPDISTTNPGKLKVAAEEFAQAMRFARSEAIRTGQPHGFSQQSPAQRIRVFRADTGTSPWTLRYDVYHPLSKHLYDIQLNSHPFALADSLNRVVSFKGICSDTDNIYFDSYGIARCANPETILLQQFDVTFTLGKLTRIVTLHGITGRVTVQ